MKLAKKKPEKAKKSPVVKKKKQSFDFKSFQNSLNSLNKDNYGSAPLPVRIFLVIALVAFILAMSWFLLISKKLDEIKSAEAQQVTLLEQFKERESKARHLDAYKAQVEQMEVEFVELLNQLPKDTRVSELIRGINMVGSGSSIRFQDISVEAEVEQEFFIEQPIKITAVGEYHQFGDFITGISTLPRIITMHNFELRNQKPSLDVMPELQLVLNTKTYRSKELKEEEAAKAAAAAAPNAGGQK